jgi:hypothetical protein
MAAAKLADVERRIAELTALRATMLDLVASWSATLARTLPGEAAYLLDRLATEVDSGALSLGGRPRISNSSFSVRKEKS